MNTVLPPGSTTRNSDCPQSANFVIGSLAQLRLRPTPSPLTWVWRKRKAMSSLLWYGCTSRWAAGGRSSSRSKQCRRTERKSLAIPLAKLHATVIHQKPIWAATGAPCLLEVQAHS